MARDGKVIKIIPVQIAFLQLLRGSSKSVHNARFVSIKSLVLYQAPSGVVSTPVRKSVHLQRGRRNLLLSH